MKRITLNLRAAGSTAAITEQAAPDAGAPRYVVSDIGCGPQVTVLNAGGGKVVRMAAGPLFFLQFRDWAAYIDYPVSADDFATVTVNPAFAPNTTRITFSAPTTVPGSLTVVVDVKDDDPDFVRVVMQPPTNATGLSLVWAYCPPMACVEPFRNVSDLDTAWVPWYGGAIERDPHRDMAVMLLGVRSDPFDPALGNHDPTTGRAFLGVPAGSSADVANGLVVAQAPGAMANTALRFMALWNRSIGYGFMSYVHDTSRALWGFYTGAGLTHTLMGWVLQPDGSGAVNNTLPGATEIRLQIVTGQLYECCQVYKAYLVASAPSWLRPRIFDGGTNPKRVSDHVRKAELVLVESAVANGASQPHQFDDMDKLFASIAGLATYLGTPAGRRVLGLWYEYYAALGNWPAVALKSSFAPAMAAVRADPRLSVGVYSSLGRYAPSNPDYAAQGLDDYAYWFGKDAIAKIPTAVDVTGSDFVWIQPADATAIAALTTDVYNVLRFANGPYGFFGDTWASSGQELVNWNPAHAPNGESVAQDMAALMAQIRTEQRAHVNGDPEFWIMSENFLAPFLDVFDLDSTKLTAIIPFGMQHAHWVLSWILGERVLFSSVFEFGAGFRPQAPNDANPDTTGTLQVNTLWHAMDFSAGRIPSIGYFPLAGVRPGVTVGMSSGWVKLLDYLRDAIIVWDRLPRVREARREGPGLAPIPGQFQDLWIHEDNVATDGSPAVGDLKVVAFLRGHPDGTSMFLWVINWTPGAGSVPVAFTLPKALYPMLAATYTVEQWDTAGAKTLVASVASGDYAVNVTVPEFRTVCLEFTP